MSKRPRSPSPSETSASHLPLRRTALPDGRFTASGRPTLDRLLAHQEIFLRILSFLSPTELAQVQGVSRYWAHMTLDPQLWKRLYLSRYPHPHHSKLLYRDRETAGTSTPPPRSLRPIARFPSRAFPPPSPSRSPSASSLSHTYTSPALPPRRGIQNGKGVATPLATGSSNVSDQVGYGVRNDGVDWKMMLRLGTNWSNGNVLSETTIPLPPSPSPSLSSTADPSNELDDHHTEGASDNSTAPPYSEQHIALFPSFIFTSAPDSPLVHAYRSHPPDSANASPPTSLGIIPPPPGWSSPHRPDNVTAICADQSVTELEVEDETAPATRPALPARLAVFYQSGGFVVLRVRLDEAATGRGSLIWSREHVHSARSRPRSVRHCATAYAPLLGDPVVLATMHYPVLLACSLSFQLSVYKLSAPVSDDQPSEPRHLQTLRSDTSFHPAALTLLPIDIDVNTPESDFSANSSTQSFRAALTYSTPLYPASWTIAVQEFGIDLSSPDKTPVGFSRQVWRGECFHVGRGDELDPPDKLDWPRRIKSVVGVRGRRAVGVGTDGRWCVLAGDDNQIQVYSLPTPSPSPPPSIPDRAPSTSSKTAPIVHSQTLLAHSAAVTSISLSVGRCVSGGRDGRVLVWELDEQVSDLDDSEAGDGRVEGRRGRTVGYVEVKPGGRRHVWRGPSGPDKDAEDSDVENEGRGGGDGDNKAARATYRLYDGLPHPASISAAARSLFLPRPPEMPAARHTGADRPPVIRQLAFDEEKIVGLIRDERRPGRRGAGAEMMKVWSFNH